MMILKLLLLIFTTQSILSPAITVKAAQLTVQSVGDGKFSATSNILTKYQSLNVSQIYSPVPTLFDDDLNTIKNIVTDIMNVGSSIAQIISVLTSSNSLNSQIKNSTTATLLNQQLQPFRNSNSFKKFFDSYSADPLFYNTIFTMFAPLNGSTSVVNSVIMELQTTSVGLTYSQTNAINERYNMFATQDYSYFTNEKFTCDNKWLSEFLTYMRNNGLSNLSNGLGQLSQNQVNAVCQIKINNDTLNSSQQE
jgi:hypothetical protein